MSAGWSGIPSIVYAPLIYGCTTVMYEGKPVGPPDAGAFRRVIEQHRVRVFFTAPTAFRAIKREDPDGRLIRERDLALFLAGNGPIHPPSPGSKTSCASRLSTIGGRPRPAGRSAPIAWASNGSR
jgi:acyl-coenzyme A synthetase/AMP-(fatty) acid ligase